MYYASICAIAKDEEENIMEWLLYHFAIGFEHILLYDNNSRLPLRKILSSFINSNLVTVIDIPLTNAQQLSAYIHALREWGHNITWLAFIDIDEFILPMQKDDIRDLLDDYMDYGGVCANWRIFSSNGHISRPPGGVIDNYTECIDVSPHIKSIVRPDLTQLAKSAHHFVYKDGFYCVNEDKIPVSNFHTYPITYKLAINHYYYKSQQDFFAKLERGLVTQMKSGAERKITAFYEHIKQKGFHDETILRFLPKMSEFAKFPVNAVADIVKKDSRMSLECGLDEINGALACGSVDRAVDIHKVLRRYHAGPDIDVVGANLDFLQGKHEAGLNILRRYMGNPAVDEEHIRQCYAALGNHYAIVGKQNVRKTIGKYME